MWFAVSLRLQHHRLGLSIKYGFTDAVDCFFLGFHVFFWRLDIWWIVAGVQKGDFCPLCSDIIPFSLILSHALPSGFLSGRLLLSTSCLQGDHYTEEEQLRKRAGETSEHLKEVNNISEIANFGKLGKGSFLQNTSKWFV